MPLLGAAGYRGLWNQRARLAKKLGLEQHAVAHLLNRYGSMASELFELIAADKTLAQTLPGNPDYLQAEVIYAVTHEGALHVEDVLARRTRLNFETRDRGIAAAPVVAKLMGKQLGWSTAREKKERENFIAATKADLEAQKQLTDEAANAARLKVAPIVDESLLQEPTPDLSQSELP